MNKILRVKSADFSSARSMLCGYTVNEDRLAKFSVSEPSVPLKSIGILT